MEAPVIKVILLAAGQATRLRPLTDDRPKCLLDVGGETILARSVRILSERGMTDFTVVDGYRGNMIREALTSNFPHLKFRFVCNEDYQTTNNAWSLMLAQEAFDEPIDEPVFLLDSDILFDPDVIDCLLADNTPNRLGLRTVGDVGEEEMKVASCGTGWVTDLTKEMPVASAAGESVGLEIFSPEFVAALFTIVSRRMKTDGLVNEYYEASFVEMVKAGHKIWPVDLGIRRCMEIDTPEDLDDARLEFRDN